MWYNLFCVCGLMVNNKKIYRTKTIDDLLNMETSVKKPVYYITNNESYDFILPV